MGFHIFTELNKGINYSIEKDKPIFLWITSIAGGCTRKMEEKVFQDQRIRYKLKNEFIIVCLFIDDKTKLEYEESWIYNGLKKKLKTIGDKNSKYQIEKFNSNTQPWYSVIEPNEEKVLGQFGRGFGDVACFRMWRLPQLELQGLLLELR